MHKIIFIKPGPNSPKNKDMGPFGSLKFSRLFRLPRGGEGARRQREETAEFQTSHLAPA